MLKSLYVDNFKALNDFSISLNPVTFLIGANASGKSTILNAIVFLKYCCTDSVSAFLENHKISVSDICSKFPDKRKAKKTITFSALFNFDDIEVKWEIRFAVNKVANTLRLFSETVTSREKTLLYYSANMPFLVNQNIHGVNNSKRITKSFRINEKDSYEEQIMRGEYKYSLISTIGSEDEEMYPTLFSIKKFLMATEPFDLLSPKDMRDSARGNTGSIGRYGERLAAFVKNMNDDEKKDLVSSIRTVFPHITNIKAVVRGRPGWAYIEVDEDYSDQNISVSSRNVSDGVLRLIAFFSMKHHKNSGGITLLDEIENGINNEIMEPLLKAFQKNSKDNNQQFLATTHNTVLLDYIEPDNIRYIARDQYGNALAYNPFDNSEIREKLDYMFPGEIVLNTSNEQLVNLAKCEEDEE